MTGSTDDCPMSCGEKEKRRATVTFEKKKAFQCAKTRFCIAPPNPIVTIHLGLPGYRWNLLPIVRGGTKRRPNELGGHRDKCDSTFLGARRCLQKIINGSYRQLNQLPQEVFS